MRIDPKTKDIYMVRGDNESITVKLKTGTFVAGNIVELNVKKFPEDTTKVIHVEVTTFEQDGSAVISIPHNLTKDLPFGDYTYEIKRYVSAGNPQTIVPVEDPNRRIRKFVLLKENS